VTDSHLSSDREWPHWPNFNQFKRQAKELLKSYRAGDASAVAEVEREVIAWAEAGVAGYLPRTAGLNEIVKLLKDIRRGEQACSGEITAALLRRIASGPRTASPPAATTITLTSRERDVVDCITEGASNKEIASTLDISEATVKTHINSLLGKLGVTDRTQAATAAIQRGIVPLESLRKPKT